MFLYFCIFFIILVMSHHRHHRPVTTDKSSIERRIYRLHRGETMILELEGNATTGYQWDIIGQEGDTVTIERPFKYYTHTNPVAGQGGWYTSIVTASSQVKGKTILALRYHPSWDVWDVSPPPGTTPTMLIEFDVI